eukprot:2169969-Pyramimonas_sp.AAC.2
MLRSAGRLPTGSQQSSLGCKISGCPHNYAPYLFRISSATTQFILLVTDVAGSSVALVCS